MVQAWATLVALAGAGFKTDKQQQGNLAQQVNGKQLIIMTLIQISRRLIAEMTMISIAI